MNAKERVFIISILFIVIAMVTADLITDAGEGVHWSHLTLEGLMAFAAMVGVFVLMRGSFALKRSLVDERKNLALVQSEADKWRNQYKKYLDGLSKAIDEQLTGWNLTGSEKEIALLLLKGISLKEIADIRKTTEKTTRTQATTIYSKAGLAGRSELAAFFLEDLLAPPRSASKDAGADELDSLMNADD